MNASRLPTQPLKTYDDIHVAAGACARIDDVPWWACFGYAASMVGGTDAVSLYETARLWLAGYRTTEEKESPRNDTEKLINAIISEPL